MKISKQLFKARKDWPYHVSVGGVVVKLDGGKRLYAILYMTRRWHDSDVNGKSWHLPKGTLEDNENLSDGALREIREETGLESRLLGYLGATQREHKPYYEQKTTHYFLTEYISGDGSDMDREHDGLEWQSSEQAIANLKTSKKREEDVVRRAELFMKHNSS